jgi:hypothetical protein
VAVLACAPQRPRTTRAAMSPLPFPCRQAPVYQAFSPRGKDLRRRPRVESDSGRTGGGAANVDDLVSASLWADPHRAGHGAAAARAGLEPGGVLVAATVLAARLLLGVPCVSQPVQALPRHTAASRTLTSPPTAALVSVGITETAPTSADALSGCPVDVTGQVATACANAGGACVRAPLAA